MCLGCSGEGNDSATCSVPNHGPYHPGQSHPKEQHWRAAAVMKRQRICRAVGCKCAKTVTSLIEDTLITINHYSCNFWVWCKAVFVKVKYLEVKLPEN